MNNLERNDNRNESIKDMCVTFDYTLVWALLHKLSAKTTIVARKNDDAYVHLNFNQSYDLHYTLSSYIDFLYNGARADTFVWIDQQSCILCSCYNANLKKKL